MHPRHTTEGGACNTQEGRNMIQRNMVNDIGLDHHAPEAFPSMRLFVKGLQIKKADTNGPRIGEGLRIIITGNLVNKTFIGYDYLVREVKKNVFFATLIINHIRPEKTGDGNSQEPADTIHGIIAINLEEPSWKGLPAGQKESLNSVMGLRPAICGIIISFNSPLTAALTL